jgi:hypothetical protein
MIYIFKEQFVALVGGKWEKLVHKNPDPEMSI